MRIEIRSFSPSGRVREESSVDTLSLESRSEADVGDKDTVRVQSKRVSDLSNGKKKKKSIRKRAGVDLYKQYGTYPHRN